MLNLDSTCLVAGRQIFYIGYNLPAHKYLSLDASNSGTYVLNITFGSPFPIAATDIEEVHIILPEFSSNIRWVTPFEVDEQTNDIHVTYLDTIGRPVLILNKKNVMRLHDQYFQVIYNYSSIYSLQEPFIIFFAFFLFFVASMAYMRIELSIGDNSDVPIRKSRRADRVGQVINIILSSVGQLYSLEDSKADLKTIADKVSSVLASIKPSLDEARKEPTLSEHIDSLDATLSTIKALGKKAKASGATGPSGADESKERSKFESKLAEIDKILLAISRA